jgi:hypothetical protein
LQGLASGLRSDKRGRQSYASHIGFRFLRRSAALSANRASLWTKCRRGGGAAPTKGAETEEECPEAGQGASRTRLTQTVFDDLATFAQTLLGNVVTECRDEFPCVGACDNRESRMLLGHLLQDIEQTMLPF